MVKKKNNNKSNTPAVRSTFFQASSPPNTSVTSFCFRTSFLEICSTQGTLQENILAAQDLLVHPSTTNCVCARVRSKQKMGNNKQGMPTILTYLAFDGKDVRARWAEESQRLAHACILYQQQVSTCWTELHSLSVCNTTISTCKQRPCETMFCIKKRKGRRLFRQQFWCSPLVSLPR